MNVGIITASDKGAQGEREDLSGAKIAEIMESHARRSLTVRFHTIRKNDLREQDLWKLIRNIGYHKIQNINKKRKFI